MMRKVYYDQTLSFVSVDVFSLSLLLLLDLGFDSHHADNVNDVF